MAETKDIVILSEGKGKDKVVYHYTEESISTYVKEELIAAVEAGEKSPFMRLLHLRKGNLNYVKKDCTDAILDKIESFNTKVKSDENLVVEHLSGGYETTIKNIVNQTIDGLLTNVDFAKQMIIENPIQVIELGLFKDFINKDKEMFVLLFNSLASSSDTNAGKLADKLFDKHIVNDIEILMMIAKNRKAEKYVVKALESNIISSKTQYAKFARIAVKYNPGVLNSIEPTKLAPADILHIVKMNMMKTPSVVTMLSYLDEKTAKRYLKIAIKYSNQKMLAQYDKINAIEDENKRNKKFAKFKMEKEAYLAEFGQCARQVGAYIAGCEKYVAEQKMNELNAQAEARHDERVGEINKKYIRLKSDEDYIIEKHREEKIMDSFDSVTKEDEEQIFIQVIKDMGLNSLERDESETYKAIIKTKLDEIDKNFPKDKYPENNKKLRKEAIKQTFKDLLAGKVKTKLTQKLYNKSLQRREKIAKKLTDERVSVLIDEKYAQLIEEFEIKYNEAIQKLEDEKNKEINQSEKLKNRQIGRNLSNKNKKEKKIDENMEAVLKEIKSIDDLSV